MVLTTSNNEGGIGFGSEMENTMNTAMTTELVPTHFIKKRQTRDLIECMEVANAVGTGTYGVVYKAIDKSEITRPQVALKKIKMERETQGFPVTAIREIKILHLMNHDNIIKLREIITYDKESNDEKEKNELKLKGITLGDVFMVFEYIEYDLDGLIKSPNFYLTADMIKSYMYQLLSGILYLHDKKILHRDIKSANLLISKNNVLKIADWGLARTLPPPNHKLTVPVVTLWYRSPELVYGTKHYGTEIDMWSVGCIFAELRQKSELFRAGTEPEIIELIFRLLGTPQGSLLDQYKTYPDWEKINFTKTYQSRLSAEYSRQFDTFGLSLLERLLDLNPATRITAKEALEHRYFSPDTLPTPSTLPPIDLAPVTGWTQQEKVRKEREEQRKAAELQAHLPPQPVRPPNPPPPPPTAIQGTARPKDARNRDRENNPKLNKFNIIKKPSAAAGGAPPPPPTTSAPPPPPPQDRREEDRPPLDDPNSKRQKIDHYPSSTYSAPPPPPPLGPPPSSHYPPHQQYPPSHYPPRSPRSSHHSSSHYPPQSHSHHSDHRPPPPPHSSHHHSNSHNNREGNRDNNYYRR